MASQALPTWSWREDQAEWSKQRTGCRLHSFYRWYPDKADDFKGFNQMQRGAGPGANTGDFGLIGSSMAG